MRIIFAGTPETAVPSLKKLNDEHSIVAVLTRAPAKVGRKQELRNSPVHEMALELGLPVLTPSSLKGPEIEAVITELAPEAIAVVAYGLLIPKNLLDVPTHGWFNLHFSLLPRWRGASPVQAALAAGDEVTGTSVFRIEAGLDTGPIASMLEEKIPDDADAEAMLKHLSHTGAQQLTDVFETMSEGKLVLTEQEGESTYAGLLRARDGEINWLKDATAIRNQIRGLNPEPGTWSTLHGQRIKIRGARIDGTALEPGQILLGKKVLVGTGSQSIELDMVAPAGKRWMEASAWARGLKGDALIFDIKNEDEGSDQ
ncbi:methionyl-tRNA formyltransferase [Arcanobacterium ihumii]|uniref:methionyl-tRNA formyltransferase n=1 Tax=Arcanobacterium ihumii TaxID=2138162 RepID=UPI000F543100|nr:methionyl-tRNA formyltransferase [Arcanobacterium ihumii]